MTDLNEHHRELAQKYYDEEMIAINVVTGEGATNELRIVPLTMTTADAVELADLLAHAGCTGVSIVAPSPKFLGWSVEDIMEKLTADDEQEPLTTNLLTSRQCFVEQHEQCQKPTECQCECHTLAASIVKHNICEHCGSLKPVGQSCGCFDNGCQ